LSEVNESKLSMLKLNVCTTNVSQDCFLLAYSTLNSSLTYFLSFYIKHTEFLIWLHMISVSDMENFYLVGIYIYIYERKREVSFESPDLRSMAKSCFIFEVLRCRYDNQIINKIKYSIYSNQTTKQLFQEK